MAYAGEIIDDPISKQRITFLKTARDTFGEILRFEVCMAPGGFMNRHMHPTQRERVEVVSGTVRFRIRSRERNLASGQALVVNPGEAHEVHNQSGANAVLVIEVRPALKTGEGARDHFRPRYRGEDEPIRTAQERAATRDHRVRVHERGSPSRYPLGRAEDNGGPARRSRPAPRLSSQLLPLRRWRRGSLDESVTNRGFRPPREPTTLRAARDTEERRRENIGQLTDVLFEKAPQDGLQAR